MTSSLLALVVASCVATLVAFLLGAGWYAVLGDRLAALSPAYAADAPATAASVGGELARCAVLATAVTGLVVLTDSTTWLAGLLLGGVLWAGFPLVLLAGSVLHERVPWRLAAVHAGDWLLKLLTLSTLLAAWR